MQTKAFNFYKFSSLHLPVIGTSSKNRKRYLKKKETKDKKCGKEITPELP